MSCHYIIFTNHDICASLPLSPSVWDRFIYSFTSWFGYFGIRDLATSRVPRLRHFEKRKWNHMNHWGSSFWRKLNWTEQDALDTPGGTEVYVERMRSQALLLWTRSWCDGFASWRLRELATSRGFSFGTTWASRSFGIRTASGIRCTGRLRDWSHTISDPPLSC